MTFGAFSSAEAETVAIADHSPGDTLLIFAGRSDSGSLPTIPAGWKCANARSLNSTTKSFGCFYRLAESSNESSGNWTNAGFLLSAVYSSDNYVIPVGQSNNANGAANTTLNYLTVSAYDAVLATGNRMQNPSAFLLGCAYTKQNASGIESPPNGMSLVDGSQGSAAHQIAVHLTTNPVSAWGNTGVTVADAVDWITLLVELSDTGISKSSGTAGFTGIRGISRRLGT